jgi:hypothetical protein
MRAQPKFPASYNWSSGGDPQDANYRYYSFGLDWESTLAPSRLVVTSFSPADPSLDDLRELKRGLSEWEDDHRKWLDDHLIEVLVPQAWAG